MSGDAKVLQGVCTLAISILWISLLQIMFSFMVLIHRQFESTVCQHPVKANTSEPVGPLMRQQQLQYCYKVNKNLPIAVSNSYSNKF
jgi:hypothetical protein